MTIKLLRAECVAAEHSVDGLAELQMQPLFRKNKRKENDIMQKD
jgi:hypothetical protein